MSSSKDEIMKDLYESLSPKYMSAELDSVRSLLIGLRQEMEVIKTVYGNEEIISIMKKAEDTRHELDLIKPELETLVSVIYELKSALRIPKLNQQHTSAQYEYTKPKTFSNVEHEQTAAKPDVLKSQPEETIRSHDSEVRSIMKQYEDAIQTLSSEYKSRMNDVESTRSELSALYTQRESMLKELGTIKSELESTRSLGNSNEVQLIRDKINSIKLELSSLEQEKNRSEAALGDVQSEISLARSELAELFVKIDNTQSKLDLKNNDVSTAKRELEFIERELAHVHERDEIRKLVKASSEMISEVNAKYLESEKKLKVLQGILAEKAARPSTGTGEGV